MEYSYADLKKKNVTELREIAKDHIQGYTQMNKEHLLEAICKTLNIDMHVHHKVVGIDKSKVKAEIKKLKKERDEHLQAKNRDELVRVRKEIKKLKNKLRSAAV